MREAMKNSSGCTALSASQSLSIQRSGERGSALVAALMCLLALFAITLAATKIRVASARDIEYKNTQAMQYWDARAGAATVEASLIADIPSIFDAEMLRAQIAVGLYPLPAFDAPSIASQFSRPVLNPDGSIASGDAGQCTSLLGNLNAWAQRKSAVAENYASERGYGSDKAKIAVFREKLRQQLVGAAANAEPAYLLEYQIDSAVGDQGNVRGRVRPSGTILLGPAQPGCNTSVSLSANPTTIALGASSTLTVTYINATHLWLTDQTGAVVQGTDTTGLTETSNSQTLTFTLSPIDNTTYRAHAEGSGCRAVSGEVGLIVNYPPPEITQFDATPTCINRGQSATLNFNVRYAATIRITGGGVNQTFPGNRGAVPTIGNLVVSPTTDTTYTITATGPGGTATRNVTITVKQPFSIDQFISDSYCVIPGNPVNLTWANTNAESATITDSTTGATVAVNPSGGTGTFTVNTPTTFTLTANRTGCSGVETLTRQLTVNTTPVPTATFDASPTDMELGNSTTLQWTTTNATTVTITPSPVAGSGMAGPQTLSSSGWLTVTPTAINQSPGYTYTVTVTNNGCSTQTITKTAVVSVGPVFVPPPCPNVLSFTADSCVASGGNSNLRWNVADSDFVTITGPGVNQTFSSNPNGVGSLIVNPTADSTYTLSATKTGVCTPGSPPSPTTATANVQITRTPSVANFVASPATIDAGQTSRLSWTESSNVSNVRITNNAGAPAFNVPPGQRFADVRPAGTTTYTVTVTNSDCSIQTANQSVTVTVRSCPTVNFFTASPTNINNGQTSTLQWNTSNATQVLLNGSPVPTNGSQVVNPNTTTTYRLTAVSANGSCNIDRFVTVNVANCPDPQILSFTANPSTVMIGGMQTVRLSWSVTDPSGTGVSVSISGVGAWNTTTGFVDIQQPQSTTSYTLFVQNACDAFATAQVTITATSCPPPTITSFSANPNNITVGGSQTVRLSWNITDTSGTGVTVRINGVGTFFTTSGFVDIAQPQSTTTYSLTATNGCAAGSSAQATVTATSCSAPSINSFFANPSSILNGQSSTLQWNTSNAAQVLLNGNPVANSGSMIVSPNVTTTYRLTARSTTGLCDTEQFVTVTVASCPPPTINSFSVNPNTVNIGGTQSIRFFWNASDPSGTGVSVTISGVGTYFTTTGSVDAAQPQSTTTYTFTVTNGCGSSATAQVTVTAIDPGCQTAVSLSANPTTIALGGSTTLTVTYTMATHVWITDQNGTVVPGTDTNGLTEINSPRTLPFTVSPTNTTTYQANAEGLRCRVVSAPTTVTVNQPPVIIQASGTPACITRGQSPTLNFQVRFASTIRITGGGIDQTFPGDPNGITNGSLIVSPTTDTTYTITATGPGGTVSTTVTITVRSPFSIDQFSSDSYCVIPGSSVNLSWANTNAETATITNSSTGATVAVNPSGGTRNFTVNNPTTFTLTVTHTGCSGVESLTRQLTVNTTAVPTATFQANPTDIELGNTTTLQWTSTNASTVTITPSPVAGSGMSGPQTVAPSGSLTITPTAVNLIGYTYTLTVTNNGCSSQTITLTAVVRVRPVPVAPPCPNVLSFTADSCVASGGNSTLRWTVSDADTVTITGPGFNQSFPTTSGSMVVSPTADSTYTLTATRSGSCTPASPPAPTTASVLVRITRTPTVSNFVASPSMIDAGQTTRLSWNESSNVSSVRITSSGGDTNTYTIPPGQRFLDVRPSATANYTVTVTNNDCAIQTAAQSTTVTVNGCPTVNSFTGSPLTIFSGGSSTLQWTTSNATQVLLNGSPVAINGSTVVSPNTTTTYRLTAISANGSCNAERTVTINVNTCPAPQIASFTANPTTVTIGANQMVRLAWTINDSSGTPLTINITPGVGTFSSSTGFVDISQPQSTTTYTITITNGCGAVSSAQVTVTAISCPAPSINSFGASPNAVTQGGNQTVRLSWSITDPSNTGVTVIIAGVGSFSTPSGFVDITQPQTTTTYNLTATNGCGGSSPAQATVTVSGPQFAQSCGFLYMRSYSDSQTGESGSVTEELDLKCDFPTGQCFGKLAFFEQDARGVSAPALPNGIQSLLNQFSYYYGRTNDGCWDRHLEAGAPPSYVNALYSTYNNNPSSFPTRQSGFCDGRFWAFEVYFATQFPPNMAAFPTIQSWSHNNKDIDFGTFQSGPTGNFNESYSSTCR